MKRISSVFMVLIAFLLSACEKEDLPAKTHNCRTDFECKYCRVMGSNFKGPDDSPAIRIKIGSIGQDLCQNNFETKIKVLGLYRFSRVNEKNIDSCNGEYRRTFSTDKADMVDVRQDCSGFKVEAYELIPTPTGTGSPTQGKLITEKFDNDCTLKIKPGQYASIRIAGRTDLEGTDPVGIGSAFPHYANRIMYKVDIDCK